MLMMKRWKIRALEIGLRFRDEEFVDVLLPGKYRSFDPLGKTRVEIVSTRDTWLLHDQLDVIQKSGKLEGLATFVDLKDDQRALVWIDGRFSEVLGPGLYMYFNEPRHVRMELLDARQMRLEHSELNLIVKSAASRGLIDLYVVPRDHQGVLFVDGRYKEMLTPGMHAYWKGFVDTSVIDVDMREDAIDVTGQEMMTADKVTLRLNALVTYRVADARKAVSVAVDVRQALYRETQLALRGIIGVRELDAFLADKDDVASEMERAVRDHAESLGLHVESVGIRDIILPGDMKDLMNRVTEAKKAAEANLISRREETAAMRSQANTAKLLHDNPTLMRLRELEVLEKIASSSELSVVLGEKGLTDRVVNLL
ncbi:MAG: slipin family protein [Rubripirellula sp.]